MPIHDSGAFTGTVESLGYQGLLPSQVQGTPWSEFFDPYDPTRQGMAQSAWAMKGEQLGEAWGLGKSKLGAAAGIGRTKARRTGEAARAKSGMGYSGTAEEMQRSAERGVMKEYRTGLQAGQSAYEQAMATGTQGLAQDIYGFQEDWRREQRGTLNVLLGMDIWGAGDKSQDYSNTYTLSDTEKDAGLDCGSMGMIACNSGVCVYDEADCV